MPSQRDKKRNRLVAAYVSDETMARLKREAAAAGMTVADYVRDLIRAKLEGKEPRNADHD